MRCSPKDSCSARSDRCSASPWVWRSPRGCSRCSAAVSGVDTPGVFAATLAPRPLPLLGFFALGTLAAGLGAWLPAQEAAHRAPARALKAGDAELAVSTARLAPGAVLLLVIAVFLAFLPPSRACPCSATPRSRPCSRADYCSSPSVTARLLALAPASGRPSLDVGLAQLKGARGSSPSVSPR